MEKGAAPAAVPHSIQEFSEASPHHRRSYSIAQRCASIVLSGLLLCGLTQLAASPQARADVTSGAGASGLHDRMMPADSPDASAVQAAGSPGAVGVAAAAPVGPDVAGYQHPGGAAIDWRQVAASGQSFAIVKATELYTDAGAPHLYTNPYLHADLDGAHAAGLVVGAYAFAHPENSAVAQADALAAAIGTLPAGSLPPVLDLETAGGLGVAQLVSWTQTFLDRLQLDTGVVPMIYTGPSFWRTAMGNATGFARYPLWEAHYTTAAAPSAMGGWSTYNLWQFTSSATIPGIASSAVDQSRSNGGAPAGLAIRTMPSTVTAPATLSGGQYLVSGHQQYRLVMQADGNLVQYGNGAALWSSMTWGNPGAHLTLQADGNLVVYSTDGRALWNSGTWTAGPGVVLSLGDDGHVSLLPPASNGATATAASALWDDGAPGSDRLYPTGTLLADQYVSLPAAGARLSMQADGNLVASTGTTALWSTGTFGNPGARATMESNGNLVVYAPGGRALWSSSTWTAGTGVSLAVTATGDVQLVVPGGRVVWHAGAAGADRITGPAELGAGDQLVSPNGQFRLDMQGDGNLVVYGNGLPIWNAGTFGHPGASATLQLDGRLVVHEQDGTTLWTSGTTGAGQGSWLALQDDGQLTITPPYGVTAWRAGTSGTDRLAAGAVLRAGQYLHDASGVFVAVQQADGNLVVYRSGVALWSSGTGRATGAWTVLQRDGNLVVYSASGAALWSSRSWGTGSGNVLTMQADGNLVLYSAARAVWNSAGY